MNIDLKLLVLPVLRKQAFRALQARPYTFERLCQLSGPLLDVRQVHVCCGNIALFARGIRIGRRLIDADGLANRFLGANRSAGPGADVSGSLPSECDELALLRIDSEQFQHKPEVLPVALERGLIIAQPELLNRADAVP